MCVGVRVCMSGSTWWFSFLTSRWQRWSGITKYAKTRKQVLYCAFAPHHDAIYASEKDCLFLKYGYYSYTGKCSSELINYIEKKTKNLQLTNIDGAGIFEFPIPESHTSMQFHDVAAAAEESLRSVLITDELLECRHVRSDAAPSHIANTSSEYMLIRSKVAANTTLQSLAQVALRRNMQSLDQVT